jgi:putative FmdB family regulatory protein
MPLYEYRCATCGHAFESLRGTSQRAAPIDCPSCGKLDRADRVWTPVTVRVRVGARAPRNGAEALAGPGVRGLGTASGHARSSIVHASGHGHAGHRH